MFKLIRFFLFMMPPEDAHYFTMNLLKKLGNFPPTAFIIKSLYKTKSRPVTVAGLQFPNVTGLAAGFDKNARYIDTLAMLGFGHVEIGTVTPLPQPGNEQPRLFRIPKDNALLNRMGFNNEGMEVVAERLKHVKSNIIIGGNIGKNKVTPNEEAINDYEKCFKHLYDLVDYFTVNVSSPNTPGLRALQDKEPLMQILNRLVALRELKKQNGKPHRPIFLKIAPDLTDGQLDDIVSIVNETGIEGIVATNTTISREGLTTPAAEVEKMGAGGISGKPLTRRSTEVVKYLHTKSGGSFPIIAAGGIMSAKDAKEKLAAGASLVQVYTGFIYEGPELVKRINNS